VNVPPCPDVSGYDRAAAQSVVARALAVGGAGLVVDALGRIRGAEAVDAGSGFFRSAPRSVEIGTWRYHADKRDRLVVSHVVGDIVLAEETPPPQQSAQHVAAVLALHIEGVGDVALPDVLAVLEGLSAAAR
jgi:hypothetical protein